ncbi:MAG: acetylornithine carbamoyltransferase [Alphaproteobacteria bacterium]|nr:acetylornithine carbamoyltransferase [Alphaproteobacteria bacterium]
MRPDLYDGTEPGRDGLYAIAHRALELRAGAAPKRFPGMRLAALFLNPSLRTRMSVEAACGALGVQPMVSQPGTQSWGWELRRGAVMDGPDPEHVIDAVRVLSGYADILAVRAFATMDPAFDRADPVLAAFREESSVPVLNLESTRFHPLQGLADAATLVSRLGDPVGRKLVLSWAPHPKPLPTAVANQVLTTASLLGMDVTVACPEGWDLDPEVVAATGPRICHDQREAFEGAAVVVAKSWSPFGKPAQSDVHHEWRIEREKLGGAGFMHCLPVRRNVVVTDEVLDASWVYETAHLRMWTAMAALERMLEGSWT